MAENPVMNRLALASSALRWEHYFERFWKMVRLTWQKSLPRGWPFEGYILSLTSVFSPSWSCDSAISLLPRTELSPIHSPS